jgi:hypothetical protein
MPSGPTASMNRIVNRMKAALVRLGIRGFNPKLKRVTTRLDGLRTPEGEPIPPNALAELRRDMERRRLVNNQIRQIEEERLGHLPSRLLCLKGVDSVEKVLAAVGTKFLRAANAFNAVRHGGPHRLEQNLSATFFFA